MTSQGDGSPASDANGAGAPFDPTLAFRQSSLPCIVLRADAPRWTIVDANEAYLAVTHRTREALVGRGLLDAFPESASTTDERGALNVRWSLEQAIARRARVALPIQRYDLPTTDGGFSEHHWEMSSRPLVTADGTVEAVLHEVDDVTTIILTEIERGRLQSELEEQNSTLQAQGLELELINQQLQDNTVELESRAANLIERSAEAEEARKSAERERLRMRRIFDTSPAVIAIYRGPDHVLSYVNASWETRIGRPGALGMRFCDVFPEFVARGLLTFLDRVYETGEAFRDREVRVAAKGSPNGGRGEDTFWDLSWQRLPTDDGAEYEVLAYAVEMTDQVQARQEQAFLAEASLLLASSSEHAETLANLAHAAVPRLGDWCAVDVLDEPEALVWPPKLTRVALVHRDPAMMLLGQRLQDEYPEDWNQTTGLPSVLKSGKAVYYGDLPDELLAMGARDERHLALLRALRFRAVIIVPLVARERVVGALTLCMTDSDRRYSQRDLNLALDLGRRAGAAVDATRLLRDAQAARARTAAAAERSIRMQRVTAAFANALTATEVA
ncbi:MAG: PAS domain-containing protein, partial [bacterium]